MKIWDTSAPSWQGQEQLRLLPARLGSLVARLEDWLWVTKGDRSKLGHKVGGTLQALVLNFTHVIYLLIFFHAANMECLHGPKQQECSCG